MVRGENEDGETMVSFIQVLFVKFVKVKVTSCNKYLYEKALTEFEFMLISGVDCLHPKGRPSCLQFKIPLKIWSKPVNLFGLPCQTFDLFFKFRSSSML